MVKAGFYRIEDIRPARELFLDSRHHLGLLLRGVDKSNKGGRPAKNQVRVAPSFNSELKRLNLEKKRAIEAQRVPVAENGA
jgi:hypothetical protein